MSFWVWKTVFFQIQRDITRFDSLKLSSSTSKLLDRIVDSFSMYRWTGDSVTAASRRRREKVIQFWTFVRGLSWKCKESFYVFLSRHFWVSRTFRTVPCVPSRTPHTTGSLPPQESNRTIIMRTIIMRKLNPVSSSPRAQEPKQHPSARNRRDAGYRTTLSGLHSFLLFVVSSF